MTSGRGGEHAPNRRAWFGWAMFAGVMLSILGVFNIFGGLLALLQDELAYIDQGNLVIVDLTGWGIVALVFGALLLFTGIGLLARNRVARVVAIVLIGLHAVVQLAALAAYPLWSLLMIALDVVVLFALTVHWSDAVAPGIDPTVSGTGQHRVDHVTT